MHRMLLNLPTADIRRIAQIAAALQPSSSSPVDYALFSRKSADPKDLLTIHAQKWLDGPSEMTIVGHCRTLHGEPTDRTALRQRRCGPLSTRAWRVFVSVVLR
jgi:hypothetical protein